MAERTITGAVETDAEPGRIYSILTDPSRIPEWAPAFADRVERVDENAWRVRKDDATFPLRAVVSEQSRTVDYLREIAPGREGGAYLRVLSRPGSGSVVTMTLPLPPGENAESVRAVVEKELTTLVHLAGAGTV